MSDTSDAPNKLKYTKLLIKSYISMDVDFIINFDSIEQCAENMYTYITISIFHSHCHRYHPAHHTFLQNNKSNFVIILNIQSLNARKYNLKLTI